MLIDLIFVKEGFFAAITGSLKKSEKEEE